MSSGAGDRLLVADAGPTTPGGREMRRLALVMHTTLDGFIADPEGKLVNVPSGPAAMIRGEAGCATIGR
jgi:hypothetical protein